MRNKTSLIISMLLFFNSCGIFKTHHKDKLLDFENTLIPHNTMKLNGYYFTELERDAQSFDKIQGTKIKYLSVFFIYEDGFVIHIPGIDGLTNYFCADGKTYENTYESGHKTIELMLQSQNSEEKRTKRICGFKSNDVGNKGLAKISEDEVKIQFYSIERQRAGSNYNSAYLYELNGTLKSDSSFVIHSETQFRTNKTTTEKAIFRFRPTDKKPNVENYFKKNINQFR